MIEMETSLSQVRMARGLTLEDAERSTRITRKYLIALEEQNFAVFPAPVYARGFLRTYCRYLGVDPEPFLAELPSGWNSPGPMTSSAALNQASKQAAQATKPSIDKVSRPALPRVAIHAGFNPAWMVLGVVAVALAAGVYMFMQSDGGLNDLQSSLQQDQSQGQDQQPSNTLQQQGSNRPQTTGANTGGAGPSQEGRSLDPGLPGVLPDFSGVSVSEVVAFLEQQDIDYLIIDETNTGARAGLITEQSPGSGAATAGLERVVLTASLGSALPGAARQDCSVLSASNRRTSVEHAWFESNCAGEPVAPAAPAAPPDRTRCEEIRGTDYRSPAERQFFLTNCIIG